jgi:hypothetical protein
MSACHKKPIPPKQNITQSNIVVSKTNYNYTGSNFKGNYVWGGAMNLAWNDLTENIVHEKIGLVTKDSLALATLNKMNNPVITKNDLDEPSYYIKSGFGQKTVDLINRESRKKFPNKSFSDLKEQLIDNDIIAYAYFLKKIKYLKRFAKDDLDFNGTKVKGFKAEGQSRENIDVIDYQDADHFLVRIRLKDATDQIFLAKGYPMDKPDSIIAIIRSIAPHNPEMNHWFGYPMVGEDTFKAPKLSLNFPREYTEMKDKVLSNKINKSKYMIRSMYENIKFDMDEKGARVEIEAITLLGPPTALPPPELIRSMILDKPYWVIMKRYDSDNPYFILGVRNSDLMKSAR